MRRHQDAKVKHFDVSNVIRHKFSHGTPSYSLNGKNVNVMLELKLNMASIVALVSFLDNPYIRKHFEQPSYH